MNDLALLILVACGAIVVWALLTEERDRPTSSGSPTSWVEVDASEE